MKKRITMEDIATAVGVSKVTVSKAFNQRSDVSDKVKNEILRVADELGYRYNPGIRNIKTGITNNIGVLISEVFWEPDEVFYTNILKRLCTLADLNGYDVLVTIITKEEDSHINLPRICKENKIDALVILGQLSENYIQEILKYNFPVVLLDFTYDNLDIDSIVTNNFEASYKATKYLIERGHQEIGFVGNIRNTNSILDRYLGYCKALMESDILLNNQYIIKDRDDNKYKIDYDIPEHIPSAFICNNDETAYHLIKKFKSLGYKIPEDCSVIGFDDVAHSVFSEPKITTMQVRKEQMAEYAIDMLLERLSDLDRYISPRKIIIDADLIERESVK